jgi:DNA primase
MEDNVSKIKDRLDVVEVLSGYMQLKKAGINYRGRCPFHNEKTPSFFVSPERQIWHCFGCGKGGDMFEFVKEIEGVEFPEALRVLAAKAGVELEQFRRAPGQPVDAKQKLLEITELATKFFEKQFLSPIGREALMYLKDRGLTDETIQDFRLGFAPDEWESLSGFLFSRGYSEKEIVDAGLAVQRPPERGGVYDRFRSRIMFPITDVNGQVVGFTGRTFESSRVNGGQVGLAKSGESMAKYVNTPQTLIYDKSRVLYGLSKAKLDIKQTDRCILVEGNMDALMSYQAGVRNVVASSGTALTPTHLRLLQRYTKNLGFCFDTDQAGAMATRRGIGLALAQQFNIDILEINDPECKDPADYVKKYGSKWSDVVASAKPVIDYYFDRARSSYNPTLASRKSQIIAAVAPFIKRLSAHVERAHWIAQLASLLRVPETAIAADIATFKDDLDAYGRDTTPEEPALARKESSLARDTTDVAQEMLLSVAMKSPALVREYILAIPESLLDPRVNTLIHAIAQEIPFDFDSFIARFEGDDALQLEFAHLRAEELWQNFTDEELKREFSGLINVIHRRAIQARLAALQFDVKEAEAARNSARLAELAAEFNELARQLTHTHHPTTHAQKEKQSPQVSAQVQAETQSQNQTDEEVGRESSSAESS